MLTLFFVNNVTDSTSFTSVLDQIILVLDGVFFAPVTFLRNYSQLSAAHDLIGKYEPSMFSLLLTFSQNFITFWSRCCIDISQPLNQHTVKGVFFLWLIYRNYKLSLMNVVIQDQNIFLCHRLKYFCARSVNVSRLTHRAQLTPRSRPSSQTPAGERRRASTAHRTQCLMWSCVQKFRRTGPTTGVSECRADSISWFMTT